MKEGIAMITARQKSSIKKSEQSPKRRYKRLESLKAEIKDLIKLHSAAISNYLPREVDEAVKSAQEAIDNTRFELLECGGLGLDIAKLDEFFELYDYPAFDDPDAYTDSMLLFVSTCIPELAPQEWRTSKRNNYYRDDVNTEGYKFLFTAFALHKLNDALKIIESCKPLEDSLIEAEDIEQNKLLLENKIENINTILHEAKDILKNCNPCSADAEKSITKAKEHKSAIRSKVIKEWHLMFNEAKYSVETFYSYMYKDRKEKRLPIDREIVVAACIQFIKGNYVIQSEKLKGELNRQVQLINSSILPELDKTDMYYKFFNLVSTNYHKES